MWNTYRPNRFLSLLCNEACPNGLVSRGEDDYQRYRYLVLYSLPGLKFLDSRAVGAAELKESARSGEFMKVVRLTEQDMEDEGAAQGGGDELGYNPLPVDDRDAASRRGGVITKSRYEYLGRHSEGNRFISDQQL
eukprot:m.68030 g.68030  ORF g.68030 m.68030 type:complete len:135 (+) comp12186_c0_seq1:48-452(+)